MSAIVIVYHSGYGHTAKVAEAIAATSGAALLPSTPRANCPPAAGSNWPRPAWWCSARPPTWAA
jgi:hypothetical protein